MADRENCMWVNTIFEYSGSTKAKTKKKTTSVEDSTVLEGLVELRLTNQRWQTDLKSMLSSGASATPFS